MMIDLIEGGKTLSALSKDTKDEVGKSMRVSFTTARGTQKLWAVELNGKFEGLMKTWDDVAKFFRDHNCIVKIKDEGKGPKHADEVQKKRALPESIKRGTVPREPMRSPRVTGKKPAHA